MPSSTPNAVITGGAGSLGRALTEELHSAGWFVSSPSHSELDVTDPAEVRRYFEHRRVDLLVCAAGVTRDGLLARISETAWDIVWNVNFTGAACCAREALHGMLARRSGHVVFISSFSAFHPPVGQASYAAAKAALVGLAADLAQHHGSSNVRVNTVLPGFLDTRMTMAVSECRRAEILATHTLGRLNTCRETAGFIRYLHERLPHTSGQVFQLDSRPNFP